MQLHLYGDFREYPASYMTQLDDHSLVDIAWASSDPGVVSVDSHGLITANATGTATISATSGGKTGRITVEVLDPSQADISGIRLILPASAKAGETLVPAVEGTDAYGTSILLDNQSAAFTFQNGLMRAEADGRLTALGAGTEVVTAEYKGLKSEATVSLGPSESDVSKLELLMPGAVKAGDSVTPTVKATNPYGTDSVVDNRDVQFTFQNGRMHREADGTLKADQAGAEVVTAAYKGQRSAFTVTVTEESGGPRGPAGGAADPDHPSGTNDTSTPDDDRAVQNPATGDALPLVSIVLVLGAAAACLIGVRLKKSKKRV